MFFFIDPVYAYHMEESPASWQLAVECVSSFFFLTCKFQTLKMNSSQARSDSNYAIHLGTSYQSSFSMRRMNAAEKATQYHTSSGAYLRHPCNFYLHNKTFAGILAPTELQRQKLVFQFPMIRAFRMGIFIHTPRCIERRFFPPSFFFCSTVLCGELGYRQLTDWRSPEREKKSPRKLDRCFSLRRHHRS